MAEFAVREALGTAEKVIIELYKLFECPNMLHADVEKAQTFLEMVHACLIDSDDFIDEGSQLIRSCVDLARSIENVLDELMLQLVSDDVQTNRSSHNSDDQVSDDVQTNEESYQNSDDEDAKFIEDWAAGNEFSTNINKILDDNIDFVKNLLDSLQNDISKGGSRSRLGDGLTWSYGDLATDDDVLGFEEHKEKLLTELAEEDSKLSTVLIVGPGGSGKSTLVKSVFESDQVQGSFDFKRWVPVPRGPFQLKQLLLKMLPADSENTPAASEDIIDPKAKLSHLLQERRYMIILDDVWRSEDLQSIMKVLPNNFHGSRIIITTRNSDVAFFLSPKYSHDLSCGLSWEKANELLMKKAIHWKKLVRIADEVLRWSGSLPYAILAEVGTMLAMKPQTARIRPGSSLSIISSVLQPSYVDLPNHLKTCFLYLSAFPVDCCIEAEMLIPLWVAEGFVKPKRGTTEEQVAEEYLNELIARSLVIATEREINGKVRSCRVLTHVRDFILSKPENFINVFHPNNPTDGTPAGEHIRRLSFHQSHPSDSSFLEKLIARDDLKHIRTLLVFTKSGCFNGLDKLVEANKYLRVLDLSKVVSSYGNRNLNLNCFPKSVLLKYLSLQGFIVSYVPESIRKLKFLETLNLQSTIVTALPKEICQLSSLRHLLVSNDWRRGVKLSEPSIGILSSIQSLSLINVENDAITIKGLGELQELRKLELVELKEEDGKELCISLEKMKHLSTLAVASKDQGFRLLDLNHMSSPPLYLQHLSLKGRLQRLPKWISKLTSLQKVELRRSGLDNNPTELLQDLPNLISLHLVGYYTGEELVFGAHTFKKLLKLSINYFYKLNKIEFADGALPMLRELNMSDCLDLKSLPKGIGGLKSINKLVLEHMPDEFVAMLRWGSENRQMVRHIPVILYKEDGKPIEDLSENVSSTSNIREANPGNAPDIIEKLPLRDTQSNKEGHVGKHAEKSMDSELLLHDISGSSAESGLVPEFEQMAGFAVREALATAEKVIIELDKQFKWPTMLHVEVENAQKCLKMTHACLIVSSADSEGIQLIRRCVDLAYRIENVLDELLLQLLSDHVPTNKPFYRADDEVREAVQTNRSSHSSDDKLAKFIGDGEASKEFSANINKIIDDSIAFVNNVSIVNRLDSLRKDISEGSSRSGPGNSLTLSYDDLAEGDDVVGFEELKEKLMMQLAEENAKLSTVLVAGPGGSGKSTLVKNVFKSDQIQGSFDFKAWVAVPRGEFQLNEILLKMLPDCEKNTPASEETVDPKAKLRHFLQQRKYLIVLDDIWSKEDLQCIVKVLPNDFQGSRIIITTRNSDVASSLSPKYNHDLSSGLSRVKARELLFNKAIKKREESIHPRELEICTDNILWWSGCLPYAILAVVSPLLDMKPQTAKEWMNQVFKSKSEIRSGSSLSIISRILQPSYVDLPNHLRTCFLYLSAFPIDYCIQDEMLIHLWVAEGFVKPKRGMTEEQVAEEYLNELIARNLVLAAKREINGKVRSCCVQPHVRDFILSKAENFITVFGPNNWTVGTPGQQIRRLSIHQADNSLIKRLIARGELKHIRTLLVFTESQCLDELVQANKYLRVLNIAGDKHDLRYFVLNFTSNVDVPILLKHINLQGFKSHFIPDSIMKLRFLETLNLQCTEDIRLPKEICQLSSLRYLLVSSSSSRIGAKFPLPNIGALSSLQSLYLIDVESNAKIIKSLGELKDLRKLGLVRLERKDGKVLCIGIEKMKHLSTLDVRARDGDLLDLDHISSPPLYLQHLRLNGRLRQLPMWISTLTSLQKVELHESYLDSNPTDYLLDLPNLLELHLERYYRGKKLVFRAHTFKKLMKLSITSFLELKMMKFEGGSLPMLRELNISKCSNLKSIPKGIGGLKLVNELVLDDMPREFVAMLGKGSKHRQEVQHIPVIHCTSLGRPREDPSENVSSTSNIREDHSGNAMMKHLWKLCRIWWGIKQRRS